MMNTASTADIRSVTLLLASPDLDDAPEEERSEHMELAESMIKDEAMRSELSAGAAMEAALACSTDGAYERVLSVILDSLLLEARTADPNAPPSDTSKNISVNFSNALCRLIVKHGTSTNRSEVNLTAQATDVLTDAFSGNDEDDTGASPLYVQAAYLSNHLLALARAPVTETNRGLYAPALILANVARTAAPPPRDEEENKWNSSKETEEDAYRRDLMDLLGRRIFALGGSALPATAAEVYLSAPLVSALTKEEFNGSIIRPLKFKLMAAPEPTMETLYAFIGVLTRSGNGDFVNTHLGGGTNLVSNALRQVRSAKPKCRRDGALVLKALAVASPVKGCRAVTVALTDAIKSAEDDVRLGLYTATEGVAKGLLQLRSQGSNESEWSSVADEHAIPVLEQALKAEDGRGDAQRSSAAVEALRAWMEVAGREAASPRMSRGASARFAAAAGSQTVDSAGFPVAAGAAAAAPAASPNPARGDLNQLEEDIAAKSHGRRSSQERPARPGAQSVSAGGADRLDERIRAKQRESNRAPAPTRSSARSGSSDAERRAQREQAKAAAGGAAVGAAAGGSSRTGGVSSADAERRAQRERAKAAAGGGGGGAGERGQSFRSQSTRSSGGSNDAERRAQRERAKAAAAGVAGGAAVGAATAASSGNRATDLNQFESDVAAKNAARGGGPSSPATRPGAQNATQNLDDRINAKVRREASSRQGMSSRQLSSRQPSSRSQYRQVPSPEDDDIVQRPGAREGAERDETDRNRKIFVAAGGAVTAGALVGASTQVSDGRNPESGGPHLDFPVTKTEQSYPRGSGESVVEPPTVSAPPPRLEEDQMETTAMGGGRVAATSHGVTNEPDVEYGQLSADDGLSRGIGTEPTVDYGRAGPGDGDDNGGLAIAVAVNEEDDEEDLAFLTTAIEYDPDSKPPLYKNRRFRLYSIASLLVIVAVVVAVSVTVTKNVSDNNDADVVQKEVFETDAPTPSPTMAPTTQREAAGITQQLEAVFGEELMNTPGTPHNMAKEWILHTDPLQLDKDAPNLIQRSVLALMYFSTSNLVLQQRDYNNNTGPTYWRYCGRSDNDDKDHNCTYYDWAGGAPTEGGDWNYDHPKESKRWLSDKNECEWFGIRCESKNGFVTDIELVDNSLNGTIPEELSSLKYLQIIRLYFNYMSGTIPTELGSLEHLKDLELHYNFFTGSFPEEIFEAEVLKRINIGHNMLTGTISTRIAELQSMLGFFTFENGIGGSIPTELGELENVKYMRHYSNPLDGTMPTEVGRLTNLVELFTGHDLVSGPIPSEFGRLTDIQDLRMHGGRLNGTIPEVLFDLKPTLEKLHLYNNKLTGTISTRIGELTKLDSLVIKHNQFNGKIPVELSKLTKLTELWMYWNDFTGPVPNEICALRAQRLTKLKADCKTIYFSAVNECQCCTECCDGLDHGGANCWQCNQGEYCDE